MITSLQDAIESDVLGTVLGSRGQLEAKRIRLIDIVHRTRRTLTTSEFSLNIESSNVRLTSLVGSFIDIYTLGQKLMNGFQKVEKIKAASSNDLNFPEGPQIQNFLSLHNSNSSLDDASAFRGLAHKTLGSSHRSFDQRIRPGLSISLSYALITVPGSMLIAATESRNVVPKLERT